jgi:type I restriction enzyme M protein
MDLQSIDGIIQTCRNLMRKDKGMNTDAQRLPQFLWMLFLKCFDDYEIQLEVLSEQKSMIEKPYRWRDWTDDEDGRRGDELIDFVNDDLFKYLRELRGQETRDQRDIISDIFQEQKNFMTDGYAMKDMIGQINKLDFTSSKQFHLIGTVYEQMLLAMKNESPNTFGEFYTPRPIIKFIVEAINPSLKNKETILDPACGTAGFLIESFTHLEKQVKKSIDNDFLNHECLSGIEARSDPFLFGLMNMMLHGNSNPTIIHDNTLDYRIRDIQDNQKVDIIMTNPPFSGEESDSIKNKFPAGYQTKDTAVGFLQHCMARLNDGGRCAIILPDGEPLASKGIPQKVREKLVDECNLHTVVKLPDSIFKPYAQIPTNILFFEKTKTTSEIWYYQVQLPKNIKSFNKTTPLLDEHLDDLRQWWKNKKKGPNSWKVDIKKLKNLNLEIRNPDEKDELFLIPPKDLFQQIIDEEKRNLIILEDLQKTFSTEKNIKSNNYIDIFEDAKKSPILRKIFSAANSMLVQHFIPLKTPSHWITTPISKIATVSQGGTPSRSNPAFWDGDIPWIKSGEVRNNRITETEEKITKEGTKKSRVCKKGTILLAMTGQGYTRGRTSILDIDSATNQSCAQINIFETNLLPEFLWYYLQSRYLQIRSIRHGGGQPGINTTNIGDIEIAYPPTPEEQLKIIKEIEKAIPKVQALKNIKL